ncbi:MAG: hypothetical protein LBS54_04120 [Dysgonamonadaceae bacterium]|jgi:hypothetical protein|nr:hypothetical protein [Dysgonamonadaceae bacterium]
MIYPIKTNCKSEEKVYTKTGQCAAFENRPAGFIITDESKEFSLVEETFNTEIQSGVTAAGGNRIYPLLSGQVTDYQVNGGDVKTSQEGFGPEEPVGLNNKSVVYIINKGGLCLYRELKKLNGRTVRVIPVDINGIAFGTVKSNVAGVDKFCGFQATIWVTRRENTGSQQGAILFSVYFGSNYENEDSNFTTLQLAKLVEGLTGIALKKTTSGKAKVISACSGDDLTETFGADLAVAGLYVNSAGTAPSSVSYNTATQDLSFTPSSASYKLADAQTLTAAGLEGVEGINEYVNLA